MVGRLTRLSFWSRLWLAGDLALAGLGLSCCQAPRLICCICDSSAGWPGVSVVFVCTRWNVRSLSDPTCWASHHRTAAKRALRANRFSRKMSSSFWTTSNVFFCEVIRVNVSSFNSTLFKATITFLVFNIPVKHVSYNIVPPPKHPRCNYWNKLLFFSVVDFPLLSVGLISCRCSYCYLFIHQIKAQHIHQTQDQWRQSVLIYCLQYFSSPLFNKGCVYLLNVGL